jgi:hypothetical protein
MTHATFKTAFAFLRDDLDAALAVFVAEAESIANWPVVDIDELDSSIDAILEESEEASKEGFLVVERATIAALRIASSDPSDEIHDALESLNWKFRKALREFKEALTRETAGASS